MTSLEGSGQFPVNLVVTDKFGRVDECTSVATVEGHCSEGNNTSLIVGLSVGLGGPLVFVVLYLFRQKAGLSLSCCKRSRVDTDVEAPK